MKKKPNVIEFPKTDFEKEIDGLVKLFRAGKVNNLVLAYTIDTPEDKENPHHFASYWFGTLTCLSMLGLVKILDKRISRWMDEHNLNQ